MREPYDTCSDGTVQAVQMAEWNRAHPLCSPEIGHKMLSGGKIDAIVIFPLCTKTSIAPVMS